MQGKYSFSFINKEVKQQILPFNHFETLKTFIYLYLFTAIVLLPALDSNNGDNKTHIQ